MKIVQYKDCLEKSTIVAHRSLLLFWLICINLLIIYILKSARAVLQSLVGQSTTRAVFREIQMVGKSWQGEGLLKLNLFQSIPNYLILLWIMPDNFTHQGEMSCTGKDSKLPP